MNIVKPVGTTLKFHQLIKNAVASLNTEAEDTGTLPDIQELLPMVQEQLRAMFMYMHDSLEPTSEIPDTEKADFLRVIQYALNTCSGDAHLLVVEESTIENVVMVSSVKDDHNYHELICALSFYLIPDALSFRDGCVYCDVWALSKFLINHYSK